MSGTLQGPVADSLPPLPARFHFSPEFCLLLACCSTIAPRHADVPLINSASVDWDAFAALTARHEVTALCRCAPENLPGDVKAALKDRALRARGRALSHAAELVRLNKAFVEDSLEVISLKGVLLSLRLFGDPAVRQVQDVDLMVRREDLDRADRLLQLQGYRRIHPAVELTPRMRRRMLLQDHHFTYLHDHLQIAVELHWSLELWTQADVEELWSHSRRENWMGTAFCQPDDDALLLLLCGHGAGHRWSRLKWLSDVATLLGRKQAGGWDGLLAMAGRLDLRLALAQAALLAHWLFGAELAGPLRALVREEKAAAGLACEALQVLLMDKKRLLISERYGVVTSLKYALRLRKKLALAVYMRKIWMSPAYFSEFPLPDKLFWLYYPLRPWLWLRNQYSGARAARLTRFGGIRSGAKAGH